MTLHSEVVPTKSFNKNNYFGFVSEAFEATVIVITVFLLYYTVY